MASLELSDEELDRLAFRLLERVEEIAARQVADAARAAELPSHVPHMPSLTDRERRVLELLIAGATSTEASTVLGISARTVDGHRLSLARKFKSRGPIHFGWLCGKLGFEPHPAVPPARASHTKSPRRDVQKG